jgi:hypothetical protein
MMMQRLIGLFALVPATVLLTISFFVLVVIGKIEKAGLKAFGYVVAALLWVAALLVSSAGLYTLSTGRCPMQMMMSGKMHGMMPGSMPMMMHGAMGQTSTQK